MRRRSWSSAFIVFKTITVSFAFQRQSSPFACDDNHGHSLSLLSRQLQSSLPFRRQSSPLACGDEYGHPLLLFSRLLKSHLPSRDNQVCWHAKTIMVIRFHCFQDYYSLLCLPKTIKSIGMWRQSSSFAFIVFKT